MSINDVLIIIGQIIVVSLILSLGIFLVFMKIPGNGTLCETEEVMLVGTWFFFILLVIGLIINSWNYYKKEKWKNYRITIIIISSILLFFSVSSRQIIMGTCYGKEKNVIEMENPIFIKIQLFENRKFFAYSSDISCEIENIGTYNFTKNKLNLNYKNEKSKYLGTEYLIENSKVNCLDCENEYELKINN